MLCAVPVDHGDCDGEVFKYASWHDMFPVVWCGVVGNGAGLANTVASAVPKTTDRGVACTYDNGMAMLDADCHCFVPILVTLAHSRHPWSIVPYRHGTPTMWIPVSRTKRIPAQGYSTRVRHAGYLTHAHGYSTYMCMCGVSYPRVVISNVCAHGRGESFSHVIAHVMLPARTRPVLSAPIQPWHTGCCAPVGQVPCRHGVSSGVGEFYRAGAGRGEGLVLYSFGVTVNTRTYLSPPWYLQPVYGPARLGHGPQELLCAQDLTAPVGLLETTALPR